MSRPIRVADDIVPIGRFRADTAKWLERISKGGQPLIITQNGRAAGVVVSPAEFDRLRARQALLEDLALGLAQLEAGEGMTTEEALEDLRAARARRDGGEG